MSFFHDLMRDSKSNPVFNYILTHWRGEFGLAKSFWINGTLLSVILAGIYIGLVVIQTSVDMHPINLAKSTLLFHLLLYLVWLWQIVGLWRSANHHIEQTNRKFWARYVKFTVVMGVISAVIDTAISMPEYRSFVDWSIGKDRYSEYTVQLSENGNLIRLKGYLGFGVSDRVKELLDENTAVSGIILDSPGGWVYEGRQVSNVIWEGHLDTYTITGCYSACTIAFISGYRRTLAHGANLAFHQYSAIGEGRVLPFDSEFQQEVDLQLFKNAGVDSSFLNRLYSTDSDDMWYPSTNELLMADVVHTIADASDFWIFDHIEKSRVEIEKRIHENSPIYHVLKTYEPELYNTILDEYYTHVEKGSSNISIQEIGRLHIKKLATEILPRTSDNALLEYIETEILILNKLEVKDPFNCVKYLNPEKYGPVMIWNILDRDDAVAIDRAFVKVIVDSYESPNTKLNYLTAEMILDWAFEDLEEDADYLNAPELMGKEDYYGFCRANVSFFENILANDRVLAANTLRYLFASHEEDVSADYLGE